MIKTCGNFYDAMMLRKKHWQPQKIYKRIRSKVCDHEPFIHPQCVQYIACLKYLKSEYWRHSLKFQHHGVLLCHLLRFNTATHIVIASIYGCALNMKHTNSIRTRIIGKHIYQKPHARCRFWFLFLCLIVVCALVPFFLVILNTKFSMANKQEFMVECLKCWKSFFFVFSDCSKKLE